MAYQHHDNGYAWYQCKCCPFGYHIDLDFVRYCETIGRQVERTGSIKRRRERRRQRQSMEVLLGLTPQSIISTNDAPPLTPIQDVPQITPIIVNNTIHDELNDVVRDFERTLQRSKHNKLSNNLPDVTAVSDTARRSSMSSTSSSSMTILHSSGDGPGKDFDTVSIESSTCGLSPAALHNIREQMALSLERTKELEEMVKQLPSLQAQIATLRDENRKLTVQLRADEEEDQKLNRLNSNYLFAFPYTKQRNRSASFGESETEVDNRKVPPPPPPRRDFGVTAGVLTRNVAVGHQVPLTKNASTATTQPYQHQQNTYVDRWYAEKSRFLNGDTKSQRDAHTQTDIHEKHHAGVQTVKVIANLRDAASQYVNTTLVDNSVNAVVTTTTHCVQVTPQVTSTGVSDDTVDDLLCPKCKICKKSVAVNTNFIIPQPDAPPQPEHQPVSLALLSTPRSKSFHLGEAKLNHSRLRNVGVQYEYHHLNPHKSSQTETKTASKHSQHDELLQVHKSVQSEQSGTVFSKTKSTDTAGLTPPPSPKKSRSTDTKGLAPVMKHKACEVATRCETADVACNTVAKDPPTTLAVTPCAKCSATPAEDASKKSEDAVTPSRIPRLQISAIATSPTTPVENRTFKRQDTYTKISAEKSPTRLTALELAPKSISPEASPIEKFKQSYTLTSARQNGGHKSPEPQHKTIPTSSTTIPENTISQPSSPRKKCVPSKEMQAAMKVLNDSLQKHTNLRGGHLKNANAIIEQEWFRISSVVHADPLDVEDYLDSFEDVSSPLLQYIVNMVDASGNTAMHYAVSHGNFDVVSILLDSKVCDINRQNKAGYTSVMLVSLAEVRSHTHADVVRRLFSLSDVNVRAKQHGQTALMLAVSHGRLDMVRMLLEAGADINIQDEDGSTALMCAAEHGHVDIVKHFLSQPDCDSTIKDVDGSMALQIAMEAGHRHIGVLLYAHDRNQHGGNATGQPARAKKSKSASASPKMPSSPLMSRSVNRVLSSNK